MRVALYLRRSTDDHLQPESLNVQEERLREYATKNNLHIVEIFADSASGVTIDRRKDFQRLIDVVRHGAPFEAILVRDVTRWGRFQNVDESAYWEVFMLLHNVKVIYADGHTSAARVLGDDALTDLAVLDASDPSDAAPAMEVGGVVGSSMSAS